METTTLPNTAANPLAKYFRQPSIYIKLPSGGKFWAEGSLNLPVNSEIPIYPMTTRDEVTLRTPDALMNGSGVVSVIESCCPNIIDAWKTPTVDVDAILIAIRIASYGQQMDVETTCPHCNEKNTHALDLISCLGGIQCPDYSQPIAIDNLKIKIKSQIYFGSNQTDIINFEEQKMLQAVNNSTMAEADKMQTVAKSMQRIIEIGLESAAHCTEYVEIEDGTRVRDVEFIKEFYNNAKGSILKTVKDRLTVHNQQGAVPAQPVACYECKKEFTVPLQFDYASFFAQGF